MLRHDLHLHTRFSIDSRAEPRDYCLRAVQRGYGAICFTDHVDFERSDPGYGHFSYDRCRRAVAACREEFRGRLVVGFGAEIDYHHAWESDIRAFLRDRDFDYVLGGVHYLDDRVLVMREEHFAGKDQRLAYEEYFAEVARLARSGLCQGVAHFDMIKRMGSRLYGPYDARAYQDILMPIIGAMLEAGLALEINLSGYRHGLGGPLPGLDLLEMYREAGGRLVTIGSDAHRASDSCPDLPEIWRYVEERGFILWEPEQGFWEGSTPGRRDAIPCPEHWEGEEGVIPSVPDVPGET